MRHFRISKSFSWQSESFKHDRVTFKMHYTFSQFLSPIAMHGRSILDVAQVWLACPAAHLSNFEWHPLWIRMWYWNLVEDWCFNAYAKESRLFSEFLAGTSFRAKRTSSTSKTSAKGAHLSWHFLQHMKLSPVSVLGELLCSSPVSTASSSFSCTCLPLRAGIDMLSACWASAGVLKVKRPYPFDRPSALRWMSTWKGQWMPEASRCKPRSSSLTEKSKLDTWSLTVWLTSVASLFPVRSIILPSLWVSLACKNFRTTSWCEPSSNSRPLTKGHTLTKHLDGRRFRDSRQSPYWTNATKCRLLRDR